jgi:hypothetical protein
MEYVKITKEIVDNQLFIFANNKLIYKRWLWRDKGRMFYEGEGLTQFVR